MRNPILLALLVCIVSGCSVAPISPAQFTASHRGKSHTLVMQESPDFQVRRVTASRSLVGLLAGQIASNLEGYDALNKYRLTDDASTTAAALSELLSQNYASKSTKTVVLEKGAPARVKDLTFAADSKGLVLFVRTTYWGIAADYHHGYYFSYEAEAKLVDAQNMKELASVPCDFTNAVEGQKLPQRADYYDNEGALLKQLTKQATDHCRQHLVANFLREPIVPQKPPAPIVLPQPQGPVPPAKLFAEYTAIKKHKAMAVTLSGKHWYYSSGSGPVGTPLSADPKIRSIQRCEAGAQQVCRLYSVDDTLL